ncbi:MAG: fibronectin type III domain-containing protein [Actinomycetales bacterium]|nr:fibronectin type III domain-containing protein [Actinomycetales bacterium]
MPRMRHHRLSALATAALILVGGTAATLATPATAIESLRPIPQAAKCVKVAKDGTITIKKCGTLPADRPGAPANVRAKITGPTEITVRWKKPSSGPVPTSYAVYAKAGPEVVEVCTTEKRTCVKSDFANDTTYTFFVVPSNASGRGPAGISAELFLPTDVSPDGFR